MQLVTRAFIGGVLLFVALVIYQSINPSTYPLETDRVDTVAVLSEQREMSGLIAINICLIPSAELELYSRALEINQIVYEANPKLSFLYSSSRMPHVTLVQSYIKPNDLDDLTKELTQAIQHDSKERLQLFTETMIGTGPVFDGRWSPYIGIVKSQQLIDFHTRLMQVVDKYRVTDESINPDNRQKIDQAIAEYPSQTSYDRLIDSFYHEDGDLPRFDTLAWVNNFARNSALSRYEPHITLGSADQQTMENLAKLPADSLKFKWEPEEVHIYQLGNRGTVRKPIKNIKFKAQ